MFLLRETYAYFFSFFFSVDWRIRNIRNMLILWNLPFNSLFFPKEKDCICSDKRRTNNLSVLFEALARPQQEHPRILRRPLSSFRVFRFQGGYFPVDSFRSELNRKAENQKNPIPYPPHPGRFFNEEIQAPKDQPCRVGKPDTAWSLCCVLCPLSPVFGNQAVDRFQFVLGQVAII